ncbi:DNA-binding protein [Actinotignum urinale]|uniref:DNA-binding protein n=1 Tax=Actinotignum urinale TaxID=190146 RepID=A0ABU5GCE3_9ACTO|nr:DNA-binding protein [Actinotignum urinale]MDY5129704.1 DNA-binding protein [Actinotignum urinale]MDY5133766.1 DNA-binding protein [Actinotignum urinale]MDY5152351.1 DNA-binding protein [Actinotignum urinale]MDY5160679.1 DNA-binding protein [Actinotignum urinale]WIK59323.1 DNA-binding protein [Actinotignum urinale]
MSTQGTVALNLRINAETGNQLDLLAKKTNRSKSFYVRELIERGLEQLMWEMDILQEVEDVRTGKSRTYTLDEVRAKYAG